MIEETLEELEKVASVFARMSRETKEDLMPLGIWTGITIAVGKIREALSQS